MFFTTRALWLLYFYFNAWLIIKWRLYNGLHVTDYLVLAVGFLLIFLYSEAINKLIKPVFLRVGLSIFLICLYYIAGKYHYRVKTNFDLVVFVSNFRETFNAASGDVILNTMKLKDFYETLALIPILLLFQFKWKVFSLKRGLSQFKGILYLASYFALIFCIPYPFGEISYSVKSIVESFKPMKAKSEYEVTEIIDSQFDQIRKPNIILISIESFNGLYVNKKTVTGKEITPVFNSLIGEGLYIEDFYGNSVQTIKGQFATYCSQIPLIHGKASYELNAKLLNCMPKELAKLGYESYFHKCYQNVNFDNTYNFMVDIGFDHVLKTDIEKFSQKQKRENIWGWGPQDDLSYKQFVKNIKKFNKNSGKPIFATIHTVSHHMKFGNVPVDQRELFPKQNSKEEAFLNSLNVTDKYLGTLVDELKNAELYDNSLIIITADHSYPNGEHGFYDAQTSYFQEFFKIPFLAIWKGEIMPKIIKDKTYSLVDIFPTVLDLMGVSTKINSAGTSMLDNKGSTALLVQPYNGIILSAVKWPYKLVWQKKSGRKLLYNLITDPKEEHPLEDQDELVTSLWDKMDYIIFSENYLMEKKSLSRKLLTVSE
ncbi:LTA synthase family protein [Halobacteriovorax sp. YZS-1-1]|uniref:LTA synthase family protein n=1 Tax=unclassified Halobacteriovorax TaxID=2639665 RepID=UPI00399A2BF3